MITRLIKVLNFVSVLMLVTTALGMTNFPEYQNACKADPMYLRPSALLQTQSVGPPWHDRKQNCLTLPTAEIRASYPENYSISQSVSRCEAPTNGLPDETLSRFHVAKPYLGTLVSLTVYCKSSEEFENVSKEFFAELERLNLIFSDYDSDSEVARLNQKKSHREAIPISAELCELLAQTAIISERTEGAVDPYLGNLTKLWKKAFDRNRMPRKSQIRRAQRRSGRSKVEIECNRSTITFLKKGIRIDLGAVGKGYIGDVLADFLRHHGIRSFLIDLGGDLIAGAPPPSKEGWVISLIDGERVQLSHAAIATSGSSYQFMEHQGVIYSHLINPKSGYGLGGQVIASVVASSGLLADAYASAMVFLKHDQRSAIASDLGLRMTVKSDNSQSLYNWLPLLVD